MNLKNLDVKKVEEFVTHIFNVYGFDKANYYNLTEEEKRKENADEWPIFTDDVVDEETLQFLRDYTGFTEEELISCDETVLHKYWNQYPFFELEIDKFTDTMFSDVSPENALIRIFGIDKPTENIHFRRADVKKRLIALLHSIDQVMPGTWHKNADIGGLNIITEHMFSYPNCRKIMKALLSMVDEMSGLFFKALHENLLGQDQDRLNFLLNSMDVRDACVPEIALNYENILIYRDIYKKENLSDFLSYAYIRRLNLLNLWQCIEFFDDHSLAQKYLNLIPDGKKKLREFAMHVSKFECSFVWTDHELWERIKQEEEMLKHPDLDDDTFFDNMLPDEEYDSAHTKIWIDKTAEEMGDWIPYIEKIRLAASPANLGGIQAPRREHAPSGFIRLSDGTIADRIELREQIRRRYEE